MESTSSDSAACAGLLVRAQQPTTSPLEGRAKSASAPSGNDEAVPTLLSPDLTLEAL